MSFLDWLKSLWMLVVLTCGFLLPFVAIATIFFPALLPLTLTLAVVTVIGLRTRGKT